MVENFVSLLQLRRQDLHSRFAELTAELHTKFPMVSSYGQEEEAPAEPEERMEVPYGCPRAKSLWTLRQ